MRFLRVTLVPVLTLAMIVTPAAGQKPTSTFASAVAYNAGPGPDSVAAASLRGNGIVDLVVADYCETVERGYCTQDGEGGISVLLGKGDGTYSTAVTYGTGAYGAQSVAIGDLNGDGIPDLVVADFYQSFQGQENSVGGVSVLLGNGDGTFQPPIVYGSGGYNAYSIALADLRYSGKLDIVVANTYCSATCFDGGVSVLLANGDGTFQPAVSYDSGGQIASSVAIGDVDRDGIPDLVVANYRSFTLGVLLGVGDGTFQPALVYGSGEEWPDSVAVGDLRGNGILDLIAANRWTDEKNGNEHSNVGVLLGNGNGTFAQAVIHQIGGTSYPPFPAIGAGYNSLVVTDLNGDGVPDVAAVRWCTKLEHFTECVGDKELSVLPGNGDGTFAKASIYASGGFLGSALAVADVNGDGKPDLIVANGCSDSSCSSPDGSVAVLLNETYYSSKTALTANPNPAQVNQSVTFTATITPAPPDGEDVTFSSGKTTLGTGKTANGAASLTTSFSAAKTYTIKANYPGDPFRKKSSGSVKLIVNP
jgi:hypothetical protein